MSRRVVAFALGVAATAGCLLGCFATIDRSKIPADGTVEPGGEAGSDAGGDGDGTLTVEGGGGDGDTGVPSPCAATHEFCADFDGAGTTTAAFGFETMPNGFGGKGVVSFDVAGRSLPRAARVVTPADPSNAYGGATGLYRSIDGARGLAVSFDVDVREVTWTGYDLKDVTLAEVVTAKDTILVVVKAVNPLTVPHAPPAGTILVQVGVLDPATQAQTSTRRAVRLGQWMHVDMHVRPSGVDVRFDGATELSRGAISFAGSGGREGIDHMLFGVNRESHAAPAFDVRFDNVVLDYE